MKKSWLAVVVLLGACTPKQQNQEMSSPTQSHAVSAVSDSLRPISEVLANHTSGWMNIPGVTGTGEGQKDGKPVILIFVDSLTDSLKSQLPMDVDGYPVVVKESGNVKANAK